MIKRFVRDQGGWFGAIVFVLMWTILLPITLLLRLIFFGRITDRETPLDKIRDKIAGN
ncbi:membrane protein [Microbacterium phage Pumpernickel]|uniref:Membrane protein n=1 Tax=Microbacterium phage Pumpernickel TaxID=2885983 RepID=A0AAE8Y7L6_9CAUD|nr:membrane protein [Microbacterium phage Pumpernickel]UDL15923.1 membrane protein [Microbacterium phage Pumpernickel]